MAKASFHAAYEAKNDTEAIVRANKAAMRAMWYQWYTYGLKLGFGVSFLGAVIWLFVSYFHDSYKEQALLAAIAFSFTVGFFWPIVVNLHALAKLPHNDEVWQCEMTDEGWSFKNRKGVLTFIPWSVMKIGFEHPEVWWIDFKESSVWVYRKPLQEAGLEEEFKRRIGKKKDTL